MSKLDSIKTGLKDLQFVKIPVVKDHRGNLAYLQWGDMPFDFKRVYYIFDIPSGAKRGGHAHLVSKDLLIAISGSFDVIVDDGQERRRIHLNNPETGLVTPNGIWRELDNFSANSICLILNSELFSEDEYIRDYEEFVRFKKIAR